MQIMYRLQILALLVFNPAKFFQKLNNLAWYNRTLKKWALSFQPSDIQTQNKLKLLDVGCATVELSQHLAQQYSYVIGIDHSPAMIKKAEQLNSKAKFQIGDATQLPFKANMFDAVFAASLINIIDEPELMLNEMKRVCKNKGRISVLVPLKHFNNLDLKNLKKELDLKGFSAAALSAWHRTPPKMDVSELIQLFNNVGLKNTSQSFYLNNLLIAVTAINN